MTYATLADVRAWGVSVAQQSDALVTDRLAVASSVIDDYTGLSAWGLPNGFAAQSTQTYTFSDVRLPLLSIPKPVANTPTASLGATTYTATTATDAGAAWATNQFAGQVVTVGSSSMTVVSNTATTLTGTAWAGATPTNGAAFTISGLTVTVDNRLLSSTAYTLDGRAGSLRLYTSGLLDTDGFPRRAQAATGYSGSRGFGAPYGSSVTVTATFGYAAVPLPVRQACILVTAFLLTQGGETFLDPRIAAVAVEGYLIRYPNRGGEGTELLGTTGVIHADRLLRPYCLSNVQVA